MNFIKSIHIIIVMMIFAFLGCSDIANPEMQNSNNDLQPLLSSSHRGQGSNVITANGWYEEEEIYYINHGVEEGVTERGENDIYLIGGDRLHQANVVEFIPGEPGYSPHWNVYLVHSAEGVTVQDILNSNYASSHFDSLGVLFDDVEDLRSAQQAGLVTFDRPGVVVNCPIISGRGAAAPGLTQASETFTPFGETF